MMPAGRTSAATSDGKPSRNRRGWPTVLDMILSLGFRHCLVALHVLLLAAGAPVSQRANRRHEEPVKNMRIRGKGSCSVIMVPGFFEYGTRGGHVTRG
jgi:hypothetical protein